MSPSSLQEGSSNTRVNRWNQPILATDWSAGMHRDAPRTAIPENAVYDSVDFLVDQPGLIRKRGGTTYAGPVMTGHSVAYAQTVAYFESSGNVRKLLALGDNGWLSVVGSASTAEVGTQIFNYALTASNAPTPPICKPKQFQDKMIFTSGDGLNVPKYYDTAPTTTTLAASAPTCKHVESHLGRVVLANTYANPSYVYFGPGLAGTSPPVPADPTGTWDTTNSWIEFDYAVTGLATTASQLLVFSRDHTHGLRGSIPPGHPGSNMAVRPIGSIGCTDARTISAYGNNIIFGNPDGIYMTNGVGFDCLTKQGGIDTYWRSLFGGYDRSSWTIAGEVFGSLFYIVTIMNGSSLVDTLICDLARRAWVRLSNFKACSYAWAGGVNAELYYGDRSTPRVVATSTIFTPSATYKNDADGTAVAPQIQLRLTGATPYQKHFGLAHVTYDMRDSASDNPTLAVSVAPGVEATTFAAVPESPFAETTDATRKRFMVAKVNQAVNFKLVQSNASSKTEIYSTETEQRYISTSAGGP